MNGNPTAEQKRFHEWSREYACCICFCAPAIHHIKGSRMKLKGCKNPGEWFVLPLCHKHHQGSEGIHTNKKKFIEKNQSEKTLWTWMIHDYELGHGQKPMSEEEYQIIVERA